MPGNGHAPPELSWGQANGLRLERNYLGGERAVDPEHVAAAICGAHGQVMSAAELSIGMRLESGTRTAVRAALWQERTLVKTFGPRGTVHLLRSADLPLWLGALSAIPAQASPWPEDVRLTPEQSEQVVEAIGAALEQEDLTVDELGQAVVAATGSWAGDLVMPAFQDYWPRWRQAVATAARRGVLCHGPDRGRRGTYASPHRWLSGLEPAGPEDATRWLVGQYLRAYGPASPLHFAKWLSAPATWARQAFELAGTDLAEVVIEGEPAWALAADVPGAQAAVPVEGVRLLPYFDAFAVASQPRALLFPGRAWDRALAGGQAGNYPVLLVDGVVAGVWHQKRSGKRIQLTVEPLGRLTKAQRAGLEAQAARVGDVLEGAVELAVGTVSVGPHA